MKGCHVMLKKICQNSFLGLCLGIMTLGTVSADSIRIGIDANYPPFSRQSSRGTIEGFDPDIAKALCAAMKAECQIVSQDWDGLIPGLNAKKYDAILSSMTITQERKKAVDFTNPYYVMPSRMVAKIGTKADAGAFKDKSIGVLRASVQEKFAKQYWGKNGAKIVAYGKVTESFLDLAAGRLHGVFVDGAVGEQDFLKTPQGKSFSFIGEPYIDPKFFGSGAGIAVRKGNEALRVRFNQALMQIKKEGTYKKIQDKYFTFDVSGD
jgi:arginine/ornithine transport system substrate-binding protein